MNIMGVFLMREIRTGGHVRYLELMEALAERHSVMVVFNPECAYKPKHFSTLNFPLHYGQNDPIPRSRIFAGIVRNAIRNGIIGTHHGPDAVIVFGESHLAAAIVLRKRFGCPIVFAYRSASIQESLVKLHEFRRMPFTWLRESLRLIVNRVHESSVEHNASLIVFQCVSDEKDYLNRNPKASGRTAVVGGDICQPRFRETYALSNSASTPSSILFVGTLGERKGLIYLLGALGELRRRGLAPTLDVLVPEGDFSTFTGLLVETGIGGQIRFRGRMEDPFPFLRDTGLLVVPSLFDSFPNVILEALHVGCPVIAASTGGIPEMLEDPKLLFAPRDSRALAERLEALLTNPAEYRRVREACRNKRDRFVFDWPGAWVRQIEPVVEAEKKLGSYSWAE